MGGRSTRLTLRRAVGSVLPGAPALWFVSPPKIHVLLQDAWVELFLMAHHPELGKPGSLVWESRELSAIRAPIPWGPEVVQPIPCSPGGVQRGLLKCSCAAWNTEDLASIMASWSLCFLGFWSIPLSYPVASGTYLGRDNGKGITPKSLTKKAKQFMVVHHRRNKAEFSDN